jgi:hypothetical protein
MRRKAKKVGSRRFNCKKTRLIAGAIVCVLALIFVLLYFTNRPNYRDLQKEYQRISAFIPADWQLVSESSNKGTWGLFCLQVEGSECPHLIAEYSRDSIASQDLLTVTEKLQNILTSSGFTILDDSYQKCTSDDIGNDDYTCSATGFRGDIKASLNIDSSDSQGTSGNWSYISLRKYEK